LIQKGSATAACMMALYSVTKSAGERPVSANCAARRGASVHVAMTAPALSTGAEVTHVLGTFVLGTDRTRTPRLTWKRIDVHIKSCESFAFDLTSTAPMQLAAFSFDQMIEDANGARVSRE
jgi:hypothetical protein